MKTKLVSFSNFNPIALLLRTKKIILPIAGGAVRCGNFQLFSLILFLIALILGAVSTGLDQWARLDTDRHSGTEVLPDGSTFKTQGLLQRCISYDLSSDIIALRLPLDQQPQSNCINMLELECSTQRVLVSALDVLNHNEIQNSNDVASCNASTLAMDNLSWASIQLFISCMKASLQAAAAFVILGIIATFVSMVLYMPFWHHIIYIVAACVAFLSVIFLAIGIGVFVAIDQDYAGFFSLEGEPTDGCLSWGFGIALAAFIINIIATMVGVVAIFYRRIRQYQKSKFQY